VDQNRFDALTQWLKHGPSRRDVLRGLSAAGLGLGSMRLPDIGKAKRKGKRKKKPKKAQPNAFGCLEVGDPCKTEEQCCSGICEGEKGKKKCKAHDTSNCQARHNSCAALSIPCTTTTGSNGLCVRTTGNASYCQAQGDCFPCSRDTDCEAVCGAQAACIVCEIQCGPNGTACVGLNLGSCDFGP
jgi:hypothetical protein